MKIGFIITGLLINTVFLTGCRHNTSQLEAVLRYSGDNRQELEKVLAHYSRHPADSLKLKAAVFLIENMPGHYTFSGPFLDQYYAELDTVKIPYYEKKLYQTIPFDRPEYRNGLDIREDVKCIKADFLIHQIELAFRQWQTYPWLEGVDFETFREYLLPYRVANEPLDYWRDSVSPFRERLLDRTTNYEDCRYSIHSLVSRFYVYIFNIHKKIPEPGLKDFRMDCIPTSRLHLIVHRLIGIPSAIDFIPHFANRNGRHYWATDIDPRIATTQVFQAELYRVAKIYRRTFSRNPVAVPRKGEYIPPLFRDPFNKDVTPLYLPVTDVSIPVPRSKNIKHAYLAVFNDLTWKPIACTEVSGREACFQNMGKDVVYLPVYYEEQEMYPLAPPFIIFSDGRIHSLKASRDATQNLHLVRKYPNSSEHNHWFRELIGARFEASDQPDFSTADTLFQITRKVSSDYQYIFPDTNLRRRYWRFISPRYSRTLADLRFYSRQGESEGQVIGPDASAASDIFDDDPLTMTTIKKWIGMDFGKPVSVSQIRYLSRNDANGIYPGNDYELFYYDFPEGWISLGVQTANSHSLGYDQVPAGGLYWLRNLTSGNEERIFTWENGEARFW